MTSLGVLGQVVLVAKLAERDHRSGDDGNAVVPMKYRVGVAHQAPRHRQRQRIVNWSTSDVKQFASDFHFNAVLNEDGCTASHDPSPVFLGRTGSARRLCARRLPCHEQVNGRSGPVNVNDLRALREGIFLTRGAA